MFNGLERDAIKEPNFQDVDPETLTRNGLNKRHHATRRYGNYHNYYSFREGGVPDPRFARLAPGLLMGKRILDLGCNAGKLTAEAVTHFSAHSAIGVDIDPWLIEQAIATAQMPGVEFHCIDFMESGALKTLYDSGSRPDIIFLFSVTKWVHLNCGDAALKTLFQLLWDLLPSNGCLILEPQNWDNYHRATKKNPTLASSRRELKMRPPFREELETIGFISIEHVEYEVEREFNRSIWTWQKKCPDMKSEIIQAPKTALNM